MKRIIKSFVKILSVLTVIVFTLIYFGQSVIPDKLTLIEGEEYDSPDFLGVKLFSITDLDSVNINNSKSINSKNDTQVSLLNIIPVKKSDISTSKRKYVVLGGEIFGIKLYTDGIVVVSTDSVETENGVFNPSEIAGIKVGDIIKSIDGTEVKSTTHLIEIIQKSNGKELEVKLTRSYGDLSENAEYHAAKRERGKNESRIRFLRNMIKTAVVIQGSTQDDVGGIAAHGGRTAQVGAENLGNDHRGRVELQKTAHLDRGHHHEEHHGDAVHEHGQQGREGHECHQDQGGLKADLLGQPQTDPVKETGLAHLLCQDHHAQQEEDGTPVDARIKFGDAHVGKPEGKVKKAVHTEGLPKGGEAPHQQE